MKSFPWKTLFKLYGVIGAMLMGYAAYQYFKRTPDFKLDKEGNIISLGEDDFYTMAKCCSQMGEPKMVYECRRGIVNRVREDNFVADMKNEDRKIILENALLCDEQSTLQEKNFCYELKVLTNIGGSRLRFVMKGQCDQSA